MFIVFETLYIIEVILSQTLGRITSNVIYNKIYTIILPNPLCTVSYNCCMFARLILS